MQRVQRKFGKLLKRSANDADVDEVLKEFNHVDDTLALFIAAVKSWRGAWDETMQTQLYVAESLNTLYNPIEVEVDPESSVKHAPPPTPKKYVDKSRDLQTIYGNFSKDLAKEVNSIEPKLLRPAVEAKNCLKSLKKTIKQREDCKLDYERYNSRAESIRRKDNRSAREETALAKHEADLTRATEDYHAADALLKKVLPPVVDGISILLPDLLAIQIMIQHSLVGQLYTVLHEYCQTHRLPSPAPPMESVISTFEREYTPLRMELESNFVMLASGKAVNQPMRLPDKTQGSVTGLGLRNSLGQHQGASSPDKKQGSITGLGLRNSLGQMRAGGHGLHSKPLGSPLGSPQHQPQLALESDERNEEAAPVKPRRPDEMAPMKPPRPDEVAPMKPPRPDEVAPVKPPRPGGSPAVDFASKPRVPSNSKPLTPNMYTTGASPPPYSGTSSSSSTPYLTPSASRASLGGDYFGTRERKPSSSSMASMASSIAAKKKPPPPVPQKRVPSMQSQFVTAIYDFPGQNQGDLSFREGDRIKVLKKTDSTDDWWEGEVRGITGSFPANYVKVG